MLVVVTIVVVFHLNVLLLQYVVLKTLLNEFAFSLWQLGDGTLQNFPKCAVFVKRNMFRTL